MGINKNINLTEFLNQQYLCESLTGREIQTLLDFTDEVTFNKGDVIADIGEIGEALYFVVQGEAALTHVEGDTPLELARAKAGEMLGSMSFFDREPRSIRIVAVGADTKLLRLRRVMYQRLRIEHPFIAVNLLEDAIVSLDRLFRRVSQDVATFSKYLYGSGKR